MDWSGVDYIKLFDGNSSDKAYLMADLLGDGYIPSDIQSVSHQLTIRFFTDSELTGAGFKAKTLIQDGPREEAVNACSVANPCHVNQGHCFYDGQCVDDLRCGKENCPYDSNINCCYDYCSQWLSISAGTLTSPNYPNRYENMITCSWVINFIADSIIRIDFEDFKVLAIQNDY